MNRAKRVQRTGANSNGLDRGFAGCQPMNANDSCRLRLFSGRLSI